MTVRSMRLVLKDERTSADLDPLAATAGPTVLVKGPECLVVVLGDAVPAVGRVRLLRRRDREVVVMVPVVEEVEEGVDVKAMHPALEPARVLLDLLGALALGRHPDAPGPDEVGPGLDLALHEVAVELVEPPHVERLALALGRRAEGDTELGHVRVEREDGVAEEDEGRVRFVEGGAVDGTAG